MVRLLIDHGADVSACAEHDEWTPLHKAAEKGSLPVVAMLLEAGADPHARTLPDKTFEDGIVPVDLARRKLSRDWGRRRRRARRPNCESSLRCLCSTARGRRRSCRSDILASPRARLPAAAIKTRTDRFL